MDETHEEVARYLAELAITNPEQLPRAFMIAMQQRMIQAMLNRLKETIDAYINQLEDQARK